MLELGKYSIGVGDRFAHQAKAQLQACLQSAAEGVQIIPVWNKSHREHAIIGSSPAQARAAADTAIRELGWSGPYHVDADHINESIVDPYIPHCDFYTLDVADAIGQPAEPKELEGFAKRHSELLQPADVSGLTSPIALSREELNSIAARYLEAVQQAGRVYRRIEAAKGAANFITEVSMDETDSPQTPVELLVILAALADEKIPVQTIAPKFTGRFNKGVDYVGDINVLEREFQDDQAVISHCIKTYGLPPNLKLSIHSGSDKFSIYPLLRRTIRRFDAGLHLKTAGTTWLEELIGLAEADGEALALAKEIYSSAYAAREELCGPYAAVIDIDDTALPSPDAVKAWSRDQYVDALRHNPSCGAFNPSFRQLLHIGYKMAARLGDRYLGLLRTYAAFIEPNVTLNLFERHIRPLFLD